MHNASRLCFGTAALLLLPCGIFSAQQPETGPPPGDQGFKLSAEVERVLLPVTVTDRNGDFVMGLTRDDFIVYDGGLPQQIRWFSNEDIPVTVGLVVDNSGSMGPKRVETNNAAVSFIKLSNPKDEFFVVTFNERVRVGLPEGTDFTSDQVMLRRALTAAVPAGRTALYDAIRTGLEKLAKGSMEKKALVVVSDGGDNASHTTLDDVLDMAKSGNALIYTIGLFDQNDQDRNPDVLKKLARLTGGEFFMPEQLSGIGQVAERIAADLRHQYLIGYEPPEAHRAGGFRKIRVAVRAPGKGKLKVRTRTGYIDREHVAAEAAGFDGSK